MLNKTMSYERKTVSESFSFLIFPFRAKDAEASFDVFMKDSGICLKAMTNLKNGLYLAKHISNAVNDTDGSIFKQYCIDMQSPDLRIDIKDIIENEITMKAEFLENPDGSCIKDTHRFTVSDINYCYFSTGFGFLLFCIKHETGEDPSSIADKMFYLTRAYNLKSRLELTCAGHSGESQIDNIEFYKLINALLPEDKTEIFPASTQKYAFSMQFIMCNKSLAIEKYEKWLYYLRNNFHSSFAWGNNEGKGNTTDEVYEYNDEIIWGVSSSGLAVLVTGQGTFNLSDFPRNFRNNYLILYLLLLHERQELLYLLAKATGSEGDREFVEILNFFAEYRRKYAFYVVSEYPGYQNLYEIIYKIFRIETLEQECKNIAEEVIEREEKNRRKALDGFLSFLSLIGTLAILESIFRLVERFGVSIKAFPALFIVLAAVCITLAAGLPIIKNALGNKKRKKD